MNSGTVVTIKTDCVPKGLVPDKTATLLHQRSDKKWVAILSNQSLKGDFPVLMSNEVYLLKP